MLFYEGRKKTPLDEELSERFKELMIKDSEEEPSERKNSIVEIEDESDEEKHDVPSNNQMTLRHDEEFPMRIPEMETENIHHRDVSGNDLSESHIPDTSLR